MTTVQASAETEVGSRYQQVSLVDLLDRLLGTGVVLTGDVVISLCDVDLVQIRLNALITTVRSDMATITGMSRGGVRR